MSDYKSAKLLFQQFYEYVIIDEGIFNKRKGYSPNSEDFIIIRDTFRKHVVLQTIMTTNSMLPDDIKKVIQSFVPDVEPSWENVPNSCREHNMWIDNICSECGECPVCSLDDHDCMYGNDYGGSSYYDRKLCDKCYEMIEDEEWYDE